MWLYFFQLILVENWWKLFNLYHVFFVLEVGLSYGTSTSYWYKNKTKFSWGVRMLGTENYSPVLFLSCFLEFLFFFLIAFLSRVTEHSTSSPRGRATRTHNKQRNERDCLFCLPHACWMCLDWPEACKHISES